MQFLGLEYMLFRVRNIVTRNARSEWALLDMRLLLEESHIRRNVGADQASTTYQKVREEGPKLSQIEDLVNGQRVGYLQRARARSPVNSSCRHVGNPKELWHEIHSTAVILSTCPWLHHQVNNGCGVEGTNDSGWV